jgi:hypothetical protein
VDAQATLRVRIGVPHDLDSIARAKAAYPEIDPVVVQILNEIIGRPPVVLTEASFSIESGQT